MYSCEPIEVFSEIVKNIEEGREWRPKESVKHSKRAPLLSRELEVKVFDRGEVEVKIGGETYRASSLTTIDLPEFKQLKSRRRIPLEYATYENIIVDPKAFYVPFSMKKNIWGIFFRRKEIEKEFREIISKYWEYLGISRVSDVMQVWDIFLTEIYWHEFTHYIMENIFLTLRKMNVDYTKMIRVSDEEGFCEWFAFTISEKPIVPYRLIPILNVEHTRRKLLDKEFRLKVLNVIYEYEGRENHPIYKPKISANIFKLLNAVNLTDIISEAFTMKEERCFIEYNAGLPHPALYLTTL